MSLSAELASSSLSSVFRWVWARAWAELRDAGPECESPSKPATATPQFPEQQDVLLFSREGKLDAETGAR